MKRSIGIITLNAKFIQTSLSLRYLRNAARAVGFQNVWMREFVINQPVWKIAAEIHLKPSCRINTPLFQAKGKTNGSNFCNINNATKPSH